MSAHCATMVMDIEGMSVNEVSQMDELIHSLCPETGISHTNGTQTEYSFSFSTPSHAVRETRIRVVTSALLRKLSRLPMWKLSMVGSDEVQEANANNDYARTDPSMRRLSHQRSIIWPDDHDEMRGSEGVL